MSLLYYYYYLLQLGLHPVSYLRHFDEFENELTAFKTNDGIRKLNVRCYYINRRCQFELSYTLFVEVHMFSAKLKITSGSLGPNCGSSNTCITKHMQIFFLSFYNTKQGGQPNIQGCQPTHKYTKDWTPHSNEPMFTQRQYTIATIFLLSLPSASFVLILALSGWKTNT